MLLLEGILHKVFHIRIRMPCQKLLLFTHQECLIESFTLNFDWDFVISPVLTVGLTSVCSDNLDNFLDLHRISLRASRN